MTRRVPPRTVFYIVALATALIYLGYSVTSTRPRPPRAGGERRPAEAKATAASKTVHLVQAAPSDADFSRYQPIIGRDIFSAPKPPPPPLPPISIPKPIVIRPGDDRPPPPPPPSLTNWSYVGYVTIDGHTTGLIQNDETKSIKELKLNEQFQGYKVDAITREEMALSFGAAKVSLKKPLDFPIVPLEGMAGAAQAGRPQRPGPRAGGPPERPGG